ncbi:zonular occludens toxin domain-containing protein [Acinetobacter junii]|uniref:zonular occludens toxin domain-containing protein n=1 Tax=Acinetobacter junii TaxID=40215 RepID=UPI000F671558|nr:zonular occludens toxin domain-containing protein [Acinetobacter junii]QXR09863.1 zonular occludens toxin domain-containing protein [Acinetobacter junii]
MLILITGKPGSFKTAKCASLAIDYLKAGRRVFTNIDEFNYEGVEKLPDNDDWTNTPIGSVVIYDEAQQFEFLQYKGREKLSSDHRVKELEVHRHTGHDIILITQSPSFLHNHVLSLVGEHYHLHRAYGRSYADVFLWRYTAHSPDSTGAKNKAESHTKFKPDAKIFDKYKSTEVDTHKLKIPPLYFKLGGFLAGVLLLIGYMVFGSDNPFLSASKIKENADIASGKKQQETLVSSQAASVTTDKIQSNLDVECRKGVNVEKPECVDWFNNLSKNGGSVGSTDKIQISYNPNKPYDTQLPDDYTIAVNDYPRLSGCMTLATGKLTGIDQQGNYMPNISQSDCRKYINGYRPFDYSKPMQQTAQPQQILQDTKIEATQATNNVAT